MGAKSDSVLRYLGWPAATQARAGEAAERKLAWPAAAAVILILSLLSWLAVALVGRLIFG